MARLAIALAMLALAACTPEASNAPTCAEGCAINQICLDGACVCDEDAVDCDHDMSNGCEPAATCFCAYEGDDAFCERRGAGCGFLGATDNCGNRQIVSCGGACEEGLACGARERNVCGEGTCQPESVAEICEDIGWACGAGKGTDRCGEVRDLVCGPCPFGYVCQFHACVEGLGPYDVCYAGGVEQGVCGEGLSCVGNAEFAVCIPICHEDGDCPAGQRCATGYFEDGTGMCGNLRGAGQTCESEHRGPNFCWDTSGEIACVDGRCAFLCAFPGVGEYPCPPGLTCHDEWIETETFGDVRICI